MIKFKFNHLVSHLERNELYDSFSLDLRGKATTTKYNGRLAIIEFKDKGDSTLSEELRQELRDKTKEWLSTYKHLIVHSKTIIKVM